MTDFFDKPPGAVSSSEETKKLQKPPGEFGDEDLQEIFTHHPPEGDQPMRYALLRGQALLLAQSIVAHCPRSPSRTTALARLRECIMWANASIALGGRF